MWCQGAPRALTRGASAPPTEPRPPSQLALRHCHRTHLYQQHSTPGRSPQKSRSLQGRGKVRVGPPSTFGIPSCMPPLGPPQPTQEGAAEQPTARPAPGRSPKTASPPRDLAFCLHGAPSQAGGQTRSSVCLPPDLKPALRVLSSSASPALCSAHSGHFQAVAPHT